MRISTVLVTAALLAMGAAPAVSAAPCRNAKGAFIKCPPKADAPKRCKDANGKFAKCGAPGARPA